MSGIHHHTILGFQQAFHVPLGNLPGERKQLPGKWVIVVVPIVIHTVAVFGLVVFEGVWTIWIHTMLPTSCRILLRRAGRGKDQAWLNGIATPVPGKTAHLEFNGFCRTSVEYFLAGHVIRTFAVERAVGIIGCDTLISISLLLQAGIRKPLL